MVMQLKKSRKLLEILKYLSTYTWVCSEVVRSQTKAVNLSGARRIPCKLKFLHRVVASREASDNAPYSYWIVQRFT